MQTLIMGLAALAGKVTDRYPAVDVKAGIILGVCVCARASVRVHVHVEVGVEGGADINHRWPSWTRRLQSLGEAPTRGTLSLFALRTSHCSAASLTEQLAQVFIHLIHSGMHDVISVAVITLGDITDF